MTIRLKNILKNHNINSRKKIKNLNLNECLNWRDFGLKCLNELILLQSKIK